MNMRKIIPRINLRKKRPARFWLMSAIFVLILFGGGVGALRSWQAYNLQPVVASRKTTSYFTVASGSSVREIGIGLKKAALIRNSGAFEIYVRSKELGDKLQAGTYILSPAMSAQEIVAKMAEGDVARNLFTILPGKTLGDIKKAFLDAGYSPNELETAFSPATYAGHPALVSLPKGASLEGYIYPDSYQRQSDTPARTIISAALDEMSKYLTPELAASFASEGLSIHQGIILASVVYMETDDPEAQPTVAQVFLSRLKQNLALGSDVTAFYASDLAGKPRSVAIDSPYNTRIYPGLPPGPISNVNRSALKAVAKPSKTDYLYFVAGDDDKKTIHFTRTVAEHEEAVRRYCTKSCG